MDTFVRVGNRWINLATVTMVSAAVDPKDPNRVSRMTLDHIGGGHCVIDNPDDCDRVVNALGAAGGDDGRKDRGAFVPQGQGQPL